MNRYRGPGQRLMDAFFRLSKLHMLRPNEGPERLRPPEVQTLHLLSKASKVNDSGIKVSELSQLMHVTPSMVTQVIKTLEKRGLVVRTVDDIDRRAVRLTITAEGRTALHQAMAGMIASFDGLVAHLGQEKSEQLVSLLADVYDYVRQKKDAGASRLASDSQDDHHPCCHPHATIKQLKTAVKEDDLQP